jgi:N-acetylneuraminic acid mutarotase
MIAGTLLAFIRPEARAKRSHPAAAGLTFAERVAYQRAIEDVYWRHRIWPKERPDPKPSLDAVMSQAQLEKEVEGYLANSQALEDHQPITAEQLQGEMDRMAQHTKQPEVLRELFEALGNDPFVIAECLARPILTERLVADLSAQDKTGRFESARTRELSSRSMAATLANAAYTLPKISEGDPPCIDDTWTAISTGPTARGSHTAVWTGSEMIIWGGYDGTNYLNTGGRYNPGTDSWTATSTTNAPTAREQHTAVWTGSEMIVWGGVQLNTGGRYNPTTDTWTATSTTNAPEGRDYHTAVWTDSEMIVWGGVVCNPSCNNYLNTGGRYNPSTDSWTATSTTNAPEGRDYHTAVWTDSEMIVWGGEDIFNFLNTGGRYDPGTDSWTATSTTNSPSTRGLHTAVWTGSEMIVWGGIGSGGDLDTGGRYNPGTDSWTATSITNVPSARDRHTAVWTDSEMIVWGGFPTSTNSGGRYNPSTDSWTATSTANAPAARAYHTAVWSGSEMVVWGGWRFGVFLNTGGRYCAQSGSGTPTPTPTGTPSPTPCQAQYTITPGTDTIVPGTTDTGNHCDDCDTLINLPFPFQLYNQSYTTVNVNSNGRLDFVTVNEPGGYFTSCLPAPPNIGPFDYTIFALWHDWRTDIGLSGCSTWANGCGIFTSVSGTAPNRIFNIEWHAVGYADNALTGDFEVRLYENSAGTNKRFDVIYGVSQVTPGNGDTAGVQGATAFFTQDFCNVAAPQNVSRTYTLQPCGSPSPTPTATATPTATSTPAPTATATVTVTPTPTPTVTATARPSPTVRPRPTPAPRP